MNLTELFSKSKLTSLTSGAAEALSHLFRSMDENEKKQVLDWLDSVDEIRKNQKLSRRQKELRLTEVRTGEAVLMLLSGLADSLLSRITPQKKKFIKMGIAGLGIAITILNFEATTISVVVLSRALPKLLISSRFDDLSGFLKHQLGAPRS